jgi:hypothetical protein
MTAPREVRMTDIGREIALFGTRGVGPEEREVAGGRLSDLGLRAATAGGRE